MKLVLNAALGTLLIGLVLAVVTSTLAPGKSGKPAATPAIAAPAALTQQLEQIAPACKLTPQQVAQIVSALTSSQTPSLDGIQGCQALQSMQQTLAAAAGDS